MHLLDDLAWRGILHQATNTDGLRTHLEQSRSAYCGFDPTANSLTVGNLVPLLLLVRMQRAGHRPVALMGGATGLIGDPSGKSAERPLLSLEDVQANIAGQRPIFERLLDFSGQYAARLVNNADWLAPLGFVAALRDIGKHFSVNAMIQKDTVRERLNNREQGISYTEFSYALLQAYDFLWLHDNLGVSMQVAGSDQWGNIVAGVDLIRRVHHVETYGLTAPLVTKADGGKFGKTESGAIWLTADRTSPYAFYQFWLNTPDADVPRYLKAFSLLGHDRIAELLAEHEHDPSRRIAHTALAAHLTALIHGTDARLQAEATTRALFSGDVAGLPQSAVEEAFAAAPSAKVARDSLGATGRPLIDLLVDTGIAKSKREARELLSSNAVLVNGQHTRLDSVVTLDWLLYGHMLLVRRGKKTWHVVRAE
ncbi:MAG: tyrosine--tRNA ligase [Polyangiaceae bacterium]|nr:tyrosine--tRNA ligase [Polyangiaceae bacterium]